MVYNLYSNGWGNNLTKNDPLLNLWPNLYGQIWIKALAVRENGQVAVDILEPISNVSLKITYADTMGGINYVFVGIRNQSSLNLFSSNRSLTDLPVELRGQSALFVSGVEGAGILNTLIGVIQTGNAADVIEGKASASQASGISNHGQILTGDGGDLLWGRISVPLVLANGINTRFALENDGFINTGGGTGANDKDSICGNAMNVMTDARGGISNSGTILTGVGDDLINGTVTSSSSSGSIAILNNRIIDTGDGSDTITATATGTASIGLSNISNNGSINIINTGDGSDTIIATATGTGSIGLFNNGSINTGGLLATDVDVITGTSNSGGIYSYGIKNNGSIYTSNGNDSITGQSNEGCGLYNNGVISTSEGNDTITSIGNAKGMVNDNSIYTGKGNDIITGQSLNGGFGIYNNGLIDTGDGDDIVTSIGDFGYSNMSSGKNKDHSVLLGNGEDQLVGFGRGYFDGGANVDILKLPTLNSFDYQINNYRLDKGAGNSATIHRLTDWIQMDTNNFEKLVAGSFNKDLTSLNQGDVIYF